MLGSYSTDISQSLAHWPSLPISAPDIFSFFQVFWKAASIFFIFLNCFFKSGIVRGLSSARAVRASGMYSASVHSELNGEFSCRCSANGNQFGIIRAFSPMWRCAVHDGLQTLLHSAQDFDKLGPGQAFVGFYLVVASRPVSEGPRGKLGAGNICVCSEKALLVIHVPYYREPSPALYVVQSEPEVFDWIVHYVRMAEVRIRGVDCPSSFIYLLVDHCGTSDRLCPEQGHHGSDLPASQTIIRAVDIQCVHFIGVTARS
ncbi:hypothetical protein DFH06DRAFT_1206692 [Mycena polygramma]|nr:hypothetical protein DFH06DRAFT_1206692 [Mycena polygramma]